MKNVALCSLIVLFGLVSAATSGEAPKAAPVTIGDKATSGWDATTYESAVTEAQKKVLKDGKEATVTGEVVDVSCYLQLGKRGPAHKDCGKKCILNGQPIGLLDKAGELTLVIPEEHHPRRDGTVSLREKFADLVASEVTVTGMLTQAGGYRALFVKAAPLTPQKGK